MNAADPFHQRLAAVLGDALYTRCLLFVDDLLVFGHTMEEFVVN
jgi:hypothetical protein